MPRFHFHLRAHGTIHRDREGSDLPSPAAAHAHAAAVAQELMLHSRGRPRQWSLRVENENGEAQFDLYFADVDPSLLPYPLRLRMTASENCRRVGALTEVICAARQTLVESRILMARSQGRPQLVYAKKD